MQPEDETSGESRTYTQMIFKFKHVIVGDLVSFIRKSRRFRRLQSLALAGSTLGDGVWAHLAA